MASTHDDLSKAIETYMNESARFEQEGIKKAATAARNALSEIAKLCKVRRVEILEKVKSM